MTTLLATTPHLPPWGTARAYLFGGMWLLAVVVIMTAPAALMWAAAMSRRGRR